MAARHYESVNGGTITLTSSTYDCGSPAKDLWPTCRSGSVTL